MVLQHTDSQTPPATPTPKARKRKTTSPKSTTKAAVTEASGFQTRVQPWLIECFGEEIASNREERNHRFLEEALELVQACDTTADEAHALVDYVFGRPVGEPSQEVGGVMLTLAALCLANGFDMEASGATELDRVWNKIEQIRCKQAAKPEHSPLPIAMTHHANQAGTHAIGRVIVENGAVGVQLDAELPVGTELYAHTYDAQRVIFHLTKLLSLKHDLQARLLEKNTSGFAHRIQLEQLIEQQAAEIKRLSRPDRNPAWLSLGDGRPAPEQYPRVLIYTEGVDFAGEQIFDIKADDLDPRAFDDADDQPEVCRAATHWAPRPAF